ncbi:MAG: hypothetical protein JNM36_05170 [Chitinophagales bacterium]|nr:hypothetical protein [Chitinophagales bacterium]HNL06115.1 hypothetical protein [Chitinophagales bacterium]
MALAALMVGCSQTLNVFWDGISLQTLPATYYYENHFSSVVLPSNIDTGHPPFYAYYLAKCWHFWGRNLASFHWAIFPFLIFLYANYAALLRYFLPDKKTSLLTFGGLFALFLLQPTLLAQSSLATTDVVIIAGFVGALRAIVYRHKIGLFLSLLLLCSVSLRGIFLVGAIFVCHYLFEYLCGNMQQQSRFLLSPQKLLPYFLVALLLGIWWIYHYQINGFWLENHHSPWAVNYGFANGKRFLWNIAVVFWRLLDVGMLAIWVTLAYYFGRDIGKKKAFESREKTFLFGCLSVVFLTLSLPVVLKEIPIMHRYFLPIQVLATLWLSVYLSSENLLQRYLIIFLLLLHLIMGHRWIHRPPIANGWDASLAFLPYQSLERQLHSDIDSLAIPPSKIYTTFPLLHSRKYTHLLQDTSNFKMFKPTFLSQTPYFLHSNLSNDMSPEIQQIIRSKGKVIRIWQRFGVYIILYKLN